MKIELVPVKETEKSVLRQLMELYAYDFSEYDDADVNEPSKLFWEEIIREYTRGEYRQAKAKTEWWEGRALIFDNSKET